MVKKYVSVLLIAVWFAGLSAGAFAAGCPRMGNSLVCGKKCAEHCVAKCPCDNCKNCVCGSNCKGNAKSTK